MCIRLIRARPDVLDIRQGVHVSDQFELRCAEYRCCPQLVEVECSGVPPAASETTSEHHSIARRRQTEESDIRTDYIPFEADMNLSCVCGVF
jgi:hypothetical protein